MRPKILPLIVALASSAASWARGACLTSANSWQNAAFASQTSAFTVAFDATPNMAKMDGVMGVSNGAASDFSKLAAIVRFNNTGNIDARNGGSYAAAAPIPYVPGTPYHFRLAVDPAARKYSAYVTPAGSTERLIGAGYAFRTEQASVSSLSNVGVLADAGSQSACNVTVSGQTSVAPPVVSMTAPLAGATVSGSASVSAGASSPIGISKVQFKLDGADLGAPATAAPYAAVWNTALASNAAHVLSAVATDTSGASAASAPVSVTVNNVAAAAGWQNVPIPLQTGTFELRFDATPGGPAIDGIMGVSNGPASDFSKLAAIVRFNTSGKIDARNGAAYAAAAQVAYAAGTVYHFRLQVNLPARAYNAFVSSNGGAEVMFAGGYAFRTEQASVASLSSFATMADIGAQTVGAPTLAAWTPPAPAPAIAGVSASAVSAAGATIGWTTDQASDSQVEYGPSASYGSSTPLASALVMSHSAALSGLQAATVYHYRVKSKNAGGLLAASGDFSFTTQAASSAPGADKFGVKQLYPTVSGGQEWFSTWANGKARAFSGVDPQDPWFDANHGSASYSVDGAGQFKISGSTPRMYIHDPALQRGWRNVEMTVYAYRVADSGTPWGGIEGVARSNHGVTGSETQNLCDTRGVDARFRYDGHIDFEKETSHPNSVAMNNKAMWPTLPFNTWIGYKLVVYDQADGNVKLESWLDMSDGANGGSWQKVNELVDNDSNFGAGGAACKAGISPTLKLTNSDARPGSESGKPNITVYWRSDNVGTNGLIYKKMSVREINPAGTAL